MAVPIVAIVFMTIFGAPVLIVAVIMYFGFSKNRMMHRTIRMMVEKGQPIPPALLAPPTPAIRQRSDMRRGVVLCMVGLGLMLFFGAVNEWEGGSWAIGVIPFRDRPRLSAGVETGGKEGHSTTAAVAVASRRGAN